MDLNLQPCFYTKFMCSNLIGTQAVIDTFHFKLKSKASSWYFEGEKREMRHKKKNGSSLHSTFKGQLERRKDGTHY